MGFVPARRSSRPATVSSVHDKSSSPEEKSSDTSPASQAMSGGNTDGWGGMAMLAECAQTVELDAMQLEQGEPPASTRVPMDDGNYSRKDKSLGLLCDKFLQEYSKADEVCLDAAAKRLGVERRRIYDIVNVLESVE
ncbi:hypothetical protein T484DRAFT_1844031, partial [Baffinella frigidus]